MQVLLIFIEEMIDNNRGIFNFDTISNANISECKKDTKRRTNGKECINLNRQQTL